MRHNSLHEYWVITFIVLWKLPCSWRMARVCSLHHRVGASEPAFVDVVSLLLAVHKTPVALSPHDPVWTGAHGLAPLSRHCTVVAGRNQAALHRERPLGCPLALRGDGPATYRNRAAIDTGMDRRPPPAGAVAASSLKIIPTVSELTKIVILHLRILNLR
jgi:hypothetical protein